jgi:pilus assembly protein Flp/PilA
MKSCFDKFKSFYENRFANENGQGIVEYALVLAFVVVIAVGITTSTDLKDKVKAPFANMVTAFEWWGG